MESNYMYIKHVSILITCQYFWRDFTDQGLFQYITKMSIDSVFIFVTVHAHSCSSNKEAVNRTWI